MRSVVTGTDDLSPFSYLHISFSLSLSLSLSLCLSVFLSLSLSVSQVFEVQMQRVAEEMKAYVSSDPQERM